MTADAISHGLIQIFTPPGARPPESLFCGFCFWLWVMVSSVQTAREMYRTRYTLPPRVSLWKGGEGKEIKSSGQARLDVTVTLCWMHLSLVSCTPPHFTTTPLPGPSLLRGHARGANLPAIRNRRRKSGKTQKLADKRAAQALHLSKCRCMVHREQKTENRNKRYHMKQNRAERHTSWYSLPEETTVMLWIQYSPTWWLWSDQEEKENVTRNKNVSRGYQHQGRGGQIG